MSTQLSLLGAEKRAEKNRELTWTGKEINSASRILHNVPRFLPGFLVNRYATRVFLNYEFTLQMPMATQ